MSITNRPFRPLGPAVCALLSLLAASPAIATPPTNPRVGDTYIEDHALSDSVRRSSRVNPTTGAVEAVQSKTKRVQKQNKTYRQTGSHKENRTGSRQVYKQVGTQRVNRPRWVEPPPPPQPQRVYAYGRWDNLTQWDRWNEGYRTTQNLMGNKYSQNQNMSVGEKWTIYSLVMRGGNDRTLLPGTVYLYTEDGTVIGQCHYTQVMVGASYNEGHYFTGGNNININGNAYNLLGVALSSPIVLDLDHDGKIAVTGQATGYTRYLHGLTTFIRDGSVMFDLKAAGAPGRFEWLKGGHDGFLVDDARGLVTRAAQGDGVLSGDHLFGGQRYGNGYRKLAARYDSDSHLASLEPGTEVSPGFGKISGKELRGLKVWQDRDQDARVRPDELTSLEDLGITELGAEYELIGNDAQARMVSYYIQNGERHLTEDVWFAEDLSQKGAVR